MNYNTIFKLSPLLGKLTIKSLDHATLINIIQVKVAINKAIKDHSEVSEEIQKEFNITPNMNGSIEFKPDEKEKANNFFKAFEDLGNREVELNTCLKIISPESFQLLHSDNPSLVVDELVLITEYLHQS